MLPYGIGADPHCKGQSFHTYPNTFVNCYPSRINLLQFEPLSFAGKLPKKSREEIRQELFLKNRSRKASNKKSRLPKHNEVEVKFYHNPMVLICL